MSQDDTSRLPLVRLNKAAWRTASGILTLVTLGLVAALVAQTTLAHGKGSDQEDVLTTLALVLAILAFLIQIVVFLVQTNASNAALHRSEELNADTAFGSQRYREDC